MQQRLTHRRKTGWLVLPIIVLLGGLAAIVLSDPLGDNKEEQIPEIPTVDSTTSAQTND